MIRGGFADAVEFTQLYGAVATLPAADLQPTCSLQAACAESHRSVRRCVLHSDEITKYLLVPSHPRPHGRRPGIRTVWQINEDAVAAFATSFPRPRNQPR